MSKPKIIVSYEGDNRDGFHVIEETIQTTYNKHRYGCSTRFESKGPPGKPLRTRKQVFEVKAVAIAPGVPYGNSQNRTCAIGDVVTRVFCATIQQANARYAEETRGNPNIHLLAIFISEIESDQFDICSIGWKR